MDFLRTICGLASGVPGLCHDVRMGTPEHIQAIDEYADAFRNWDKVNSAYNAQKATREQLDAAGVARKSAYDKVRAFEEEVERGR